MDKKLTGLMSLFFLSFAMFLSMIFFGSNLLSGTLRAKEELKPSGTTSLILGWPLEVPADGVSKVAVTVFVRTDTTRPVSGKTITLNTTLGSFDTPVLTSDTDGKAVANFTCTTTGIAQISGIIDNVTPITQKITIKCK